MKYHHSEVKRFDDLTELQQSNIYSSFELVRFNELQNSLTLYKSFNMHERINNKRMFKALIRQVKIFNEIVLSDCKSNLYLQDGYKLNKSFLEIVK